MRVAEGYRRRVAAGVGRSVSLPRSLPRSRLGGPAHPPAPAPPPPAPPPPPLPRPPAWCVRAPPRPVYKGGGSQAGRGRGRREGGPQPEDANWLSPTWPRGAGGGRESEEVTLPPRSPSASPTTRQQPDCSPGSVTPTARHRREGAQG